MCQETAFQDVRARNVRVTEDRPYGEGTPRGRLDEQGVAVSVAWIARLPFAEGKRPEGEAAMAAALPGLRKLPGVEEVRFHADANDPNLVWAYWRLVSRDDIPLVHDSAEF